MGWGKLDDRLDDHPKFVGMPLSAVGLWTLCLSRALRNDDGFVPHQHPKRFGKNSSRAVEVLVERGLWEVCEQGWVIHDFEQYANPNTKSAERMRRYRERKKQSDVTVTSPSKPVTQPLRPSRASGIPEPEPEPEPISLSKESSLSSRNSTTANIQEFMSAWDAWVGGGIPAMTAIPTEGSERRRLILRITGTKPLTEEKKREIFDAIGAFTSDPKMREDKRGVDTFCRHFDRWRDAHAALLVQP